MMRRQVFPAISTPILHGVALALAALATNTNVPGQHVISRTPFPLGVGTHETRGEWQPAIQFPSASEIAAEIEAVSSAPPTRSSFMAKWERVSGANGYLLDVSTSASFSDCVEGYHDLNVGEAIGQVVSGLDPGTTYYYRVRPYTA